MNLFFLISFPLDVRAGCPAPVSSKDALLWVQLRGVCCPAITTSQAAAPTGGGGGCRERPEPAAVICGPVSQGPPGTTPPHPPARVALWELQVHGWDAHLPRPLPLRLGRGGPVIFLLCSADNDNNRL